MALTSNEKADTNGKQNDFLDFFSQAIERYKKSVKDCGAEEEEVKQSRRRVPPKKRSAAHMVSDASSADHSAKISKMSSDSGSEEKTEPVEETEADVEKKRLASRVSSRRTREREKLRMDHFRNAKIKLQQENKDLKGENDEIRSLIQKIKEEKQFLERKTAAVQSLLATNPPAPTQLPLPVPQALAAPVPQPQQSMTAPSHQPMAALLFNAFLQGQGGAQPPPAMPSAHPSQEQQLLSLLGLVSANPALAQTLSLGQMQAPPQQNFLVAALQGGNFGAAPNTGSNNNNNPAMNQNLLNLLLSGGGGGQAFGSHNSA
jgi:hypothetical protein